MGFSNKINTVLLASLLAACSGEKPAAVGVEIKTTSDTARILTIHGKVHCVEGFDKLPVQNGDLIKKSTYSNAISSIKPGTENVEMTVEQNSGDVIIRLKGDLLGTSRSQDERTLVAYSKNYPLNFCDKDYKLPRN